MIKTCRIKRSLLSNRHKCICTNCLIIYDSLYLLSDFTFCSQMLNQNWFLFMRFPPILIFICVICVFRDNLYGYGIVGESVI